MARRIHRRHLARLRHADHAVGSTTIEARTDELDSASVQSSAPLVAGSPEDLDRPERTSEGVNDRPSPRRLATWSPVVACAVGIAAWVWSLQVIDLDATGDTGLVSVFPVAYYAGLAVVLVGFLVELARPRPRSWVLAMSAASLIVIIHATVPLLYPEPRYTYVYKHIAVTRFVELHGTVDRSVEIYQNWSGFPSAGAHLAAITGVDPIVMANWALVFFAAVNLLVLRFVVRAFTTDVRVVALSSVVYIFGDWVGQAYFAPQSLAFFVSVVMVGVVLRCVPSRRTRRATARAGSPRRAGPIGRLLRRLGSFREDLPVGGVPPLSERMAIVLALVLAAMVVLTHPLSPYLMIVWLAVLVVMGRLRLWWLLVGALLMAVAWTLAAHAWLFTHVDLFGDVGSATQNAKGTGGESAGSPGHQLVVLAARLLSLGIWALAAIGVTLRIRSGRRDATAPLLALVPFGLVFAQSYGGEIIYRVFLFSLPWCTYLIASGVLVGGRQISEDGAARTLGRARVALTGVTLAAMAGLFLTAAFGLERVNQLAPEEVAASTWFEENAAPGSVLAQVGPNFPSIITSEYSRYRTPWGSFGASILGQDPRFSERELTSADMPEVIRYLEQFGVGDTYVVMGPNQVDYEEVFREVPPGTVERLAGLLRDAPGVEVVFRSGDVIVMKLPRLSPALDTPLSAGDAGGS